MFTLKLGIPRPFPKKQQQQQNIPKHSGRGRALLRLVGVVPSDTMGACRNVFSSFENIFLASVVVAAFFNADTVASIVKVGAVVAYKGKIQHRAIPSGKISVLGWQSRGTLL